MNQSSVRLWRKEATKGMLSRKVYLDPAMAYHVKEQRIVLDSSTKLESWIASAHASHRITWLDLPAVCKKAAKVLLILRDHPQLGRFALFKVWHDTYDELTGSGA